MPSIEVAEEYPDNPIFYNPLETVINPEEYHTVDAMFTTKNAEFTSDETKQRFEHLSLDQVYFKIHTKEQLGLEDIRQKILDNNTHVYVLLHGWTATNELFDSVHKQPSGKTIVEQILEDDPNAVIITPDALGFGKTKFKDISMAEKAEKCGPTDYADEVEFILHDLLNLPNDKRDNLFVMGHSWGGAATMMMAEKNYAPAENCFAVCPALLPTGDWKSKLFDNFLKVRMTYGSLGDVTHLGQAVSETSKSGTKLTGAIVNSEITSKAMEILMGKYMPGNIKLGDMNKMYPELFRIHSQQINENIDTTAAVMHQLAHGTNLDSIESFGKPIDTKTARNKLSKCTVVVGSKDLLAPVMQSYMLGITPMDQEMEYAEETGGLIIVDKAGHYAPLLENDEADPTMLITAHARSKKVLHSAEQVDTIIQEEISV